MITDVLITLVQTLIQKGFKLPIYIFMVSQNGNVVTAKYEGGKTNVLLEHIVDKDWKLPINSFFVDGRGKSESIRLDEKSIKGHM
jgi:hypothetical protein